VQIFARGKESVWASLRRGGRVLAAEFGREEEQAEEKGREGVRQESAAGQRVPDSQHGYLSPGGASMTPPVK